MTVESIRQHALPSLCAAMLAGTSLGAEVIDRIAAVVGYEAIALSEIDMESRLEALLNRTPAAPSQAYREQLLERLIDRRLILQDLTTTPFLTAQPEEIEDQMRSLRTQEYLGGRNFPDALQHYGLTEADCRTYLSERIGFERYVSFRFKTGLDADLEAAREYYRDEYEPRLRALGEPAEPFDEVVEEISQIVVERRANALLDQRLRALRAATRIRVIAASGDAQEP